MAAYFALKIVKELGLPLSKRVRLILGCDEESHWRCVQHYFAKEEMPAMAFSPDADFPIIHGEKGFLDIRATGTPEKYGDGEWILQSFASGQRVNMVPDLAEAILAGDGDVFGLKEKYQDFLLTYQLQGYAEENDEYVKLVLRGRAHHGSEPEKGVNAACELARFLQRVALDSSGKRFVEMIDGLFVDSFFGEKLQIEAEDQKVGRLTVNAGVFRYTPGKEQYVGINIRYPIDADYQEIVRKLEEKFGEFGLRAEVVDHKPGHYLEPDHPLVATLSRVYEEQTGSNAKLLTIGGATYARAVEVGVAFGPVFPGKAETAHQTDEYIEIEDLLKATAIYAQAIFELAK
jgi:succinyl-diaminopimelate desuccinylase